MSPSGQDQRFGDVLQCPLCPQQRMSDARAKPSRAAGNDGSNHRLMKSAVPVPRTMGLDAGTPPDAYQIAWDGTRVRRVVGVACEGAWPDTPTSNHRLSANADGGGARDSSTSLWDPEAILQPRVRFGA